MAVAVGHTIRIDHIASTGHIVHMVDPAAASEDAVAADHIVHKDPVVVAAAAGHRIGWDVGGAAEGAVAAADVVARAAGLV
jgi:hypothetical protein